MIKNALGAAVRRSAILPLLQDWSCEVHKELNQQVVRLDIIVRENDFTNVIEQV